MPPHTRIVGTLDLVIMRHHRHHRHRGSTHHRRRQAHSVQSRMSLPSPTLSASASSLIFDRPPTRTRLCSAHRRGPLRHRTPLRTLQALPPWPRPRRHRGSALLLCPRSKCLRLPRGRHEQLPPGHRPTPPTLPLLLLNSHSSRTKRSQARARLWSSLASSRLLGVKTPCRSLYSFQRCWHEGSTTV